MTLGSSTIVYEFELVNEGKKVGTLCVKGRAVTVVVFGHQTCYKLEDIDSTELVHAQSANALQGGRGIVLGAMLAGPVGAALGASMGRLLREVHFILRLTNGHAFVCKSLSKTYEAFEAHRKIAAVSALSSTFTNPALPSTEPFLRSENTPQEKVKSNVTTAEKKAAIPTNVLYVSKKLK